MKGVAGGGNVRVITIGRSSGDEWAQAVEAYRVRTPPPWAWDWVAVRPENSPGRRLGASRLQSPWRTSGPRTSWWRWTSVGGSLPPGPSSLASGFARRAAGAGDGGGRSRRPRSQHRGEGEWRVVALSIDVAARDGHPHGGGAIVSRVDLRPGAPVSPGLTKGGAPWPTARVSSP